MRLIDLDKLLLQVKMRRYTRASLSLLYNQEVVEAIPVEWIKEYSERGSSYFLYPEEVESTLITMIDDWRKENETN